MTNAPEYYSYTREELLPLVPENARKTLDVGCGMGVFSASLKAKYGVEAWGVEPSENAADMAKTRLDKVLVGLFDDVSKDLPPNYFDCIFFNDVLEHMVDPEAALNAVKRYLAPGGVVICSIPNIRYFPQLMELLITRDWKYIDQGILDRTHLRFFTKKSIMRMMSENGFEIEKIVGVNSIRSVKKKTLCHLFNLVTFGLFSDCYHQQYAVVIKVRV